MKVAVIEKEYNGMSFKFRDDGYFNMTHAAKHFDKRMDNFWSATGTADYVGELSRALNLSDLKVVEIIPGNRYVPTRGTWAHPKLAVFFARWLDVKFAVFCDMVIDDLMRGHSVITVVAPEKAMAPQLPQTYLESLQQLIVSVQAQEKLQLELEEKNTQLSVQAPKVAYMERYVEAAGSVGIQEAAKILRLNMRELGIWLVEAKFCFRKQPHNRLTPYAHNVDMGWFVIKTGKSSNSFGDETMYEQMRFTPAGLEYISKVAPDYIRKVYANYK